MVNSSQRVLPDKLFFKIGEVAKIVGVPPHVLRYWESEFASLRPMKTRGAHRVYRRKDVELALTIHQLVHQEGYTVTGAKKRLRGGSPSKTEEPSRATKGAPHAQLSFLERSRDATVSRAVGATRVTRLGLSATGTASSDAPGNALMPQGDASVSSSYAASPADREVRVATGSKLAEIRVELQRIREGLSALLGEPSAPSANAHSEAKVTVTRAVPAQAAFVSEQLTHSRKY
jgi:DNA-binding transcriptional MerR regulator